MNKRGSRSVKAPSYEGFTPSSEKASQALARSRAKDTKCECTLRSALWRKGLRFRKNVATLPGRPDIVFREKHVVVFCDGDFWHGRKWAQRRQKLLNGANHTYWVKKIRTNIDRDKRHNRQLRKLGWKVIRLWEKDILADVDAAVNRVAQALDS